MLGFFCNKIFIPGIVVELLPGSLIIYHPLGNRVFGMAPLPAEVWIILAFFSVGLFPAKDLRKGFVSTRRDDSELFNMNDEQLLSAVDHEPVSRLNMASLFFLVGFTFLLEVC